MNNTDLLNLIQSDITTNGNGEISGAVLKNVLDELVNRTQLKSEQITIENTSGNSYLRVNELNNFAKMESGDGASSENLLLVDNLIQQTILSATDGTDEAKITAFNGGDLNLLATVGLYLQANEIFINGVSVYSNTDEFFITANAGNIVLDASDDVNLNSGNSLNLNPQNSLLAVIGNALNIQTGNDAIIEAGGVFNLRSVIGKLQIQALNERVIIGEEFVPFVDQAYIEVDNPNKSIQISSRNGGKTARITFANGGASIQSENDNISLIGSDGLGLPIYANDGLADADGGLPSGGLYKVTGNRSVFQKP